MKILGIDVGEVTGVHPNGATVTVKMTYDSKYKLPKNAISVIVANSLVSDRYIQLAPAYNGSGPVLANDATIPVSRTAAPGRARRHLLRAEQAVGRARSRTARTRTAR